MHILPTLSTRFTNKQRSTVFKEVNIMPKKVATSLEPGALSREEAQDILDRVQLQVGASLSGYPDLCYHMQAFLQEGVEDCNDNSRDPASVINQRVFAEWMTLNAFNKHRLGKMSDPDNNPDYHEEDNFPNDFSSWPLCSEVVKLGVQIEAAPLFQMSGTVEYNQTSSARTAIRKPTATPTKSTDDAQNTITPRSIPKKTSPAKSKPGFGSNKYDKLRGSPPTWLPLPKGNLTLAEITAFLPQLLKCWDIIDRLLWNGALSVTLATMINHFREMSMGDIPNNTIYVMMKGAIKKRVETEPAPAYAGWSVSAHQNIAKPAGFDPTSISVSGFRTPINYNRRDAAATAGGPEPKIPFRHLANGVKNMPSGDDALDLTRCVKYCVANPDEDWNYPHDFEDLVDHLGGPATVLVAHQDAAIVARYTSAGKFNGAHNALKRKHDSHGRLLKIKEADIDDDEAMFSDSDDQSGDDFDLNTLKDEDDFAPPTNSKGKRPIIEDSDENKDDFAQSTRNSKRKRPVDEDSDDEDFSSFKSSTKRQKKMPKKPSVRKMQSTRSSLRKRVKPKEDFSDSNSDTYEGPKKKRKATTATSTSGRPSRSKFTGNYNVEEALKPDDEDEEEELDVEPEKIFTAAEMRQTMLDRKQATFKAKVAKTPVPQKKTAAYEDVSDDEDDDHDL
jgi:hypothetical protein